MADPELEKRIADVLSRAASEEPDELPEWLLRSQRASDDASQLAEQVRSRWRAYPQSEFAAAGGRREAPLFEAVPSLQVEWHAEHLAITWNLDDRPDVVSVVLLFLRPDSIELLRPPVVVAARAGQWPPNPGDAGFDVSESWELELFLLVQR